MNDNDSGVESEESFKTSLEKLLQEVTAKGKTLIMNKARDWDVEGASEKIRDYVRQSPIKSIAMAIGAGFILSRLFKSKD